MGKFSVFQGGFKCARSALRRMLRRLGVLSGGWEPVLAKLKRFVRTGLCAQVDPRAGRKS